MAQDNKLIYEINDLTLSIFDYHNNISQKVSYGTFSIRGGDFIIIKGRNGSGKSTLLHLLAMRENDYFKIERGDVKYKLGEFPDLSICKYNADQVAALHRDIVYIGQEEQFITWHSAYKVLKTPAETAMRKKFFGAELIKRSILLEKTILEFFNNYLCHIICNDFKEFKKRKATSYSGGQMKMLSVLSGIIKAKVCDNSLIIMDEPLNNLDGKNKYYLNKILSDIRGENVALLIITHCQIFDGINRVLTIKDSTPGEVAASITDMTEPPHSECLEMVKERITL